MRGLTAVLILATFMIGGWTWSTLRLRNAAPTIDVVGGDVFDAGIIQPNCSVVHTFTIRNPHPFPVELAAPRVGCSCTTATASTSVVRANGTAMVTLKVDPEDGAINGSASVITVHGTKKIETWLLVSGTASQRVPPRNPA